MRYVIIGASAAGINCAKTLRNLDNNADIAVISKDNKIYSRCLLPEFIGGKKDFDKMSFINENFFEENNINWIKNTTIKNIQASKKRIVCCDGRTYEYDKLLIATGSCPVVPPIDGLNEALKTGKVFVLRDIEDAINIKEAAKYSKSAVVVGGGFIGLQVAENLREYGILVFVVEMKDHILPQQLDKKAAKRYEALFKKHGVRIVTGEVVKQIIYSERQNTIGLILSNGDFIYTDMLVIASGVRPSFPDIEEGKVKIEHGIIVDEYQRTDDPDIFAAGDVCQSYETFSGSYRVAPIWPLAVKQGQIAGYNMAGFCKPMENNFGFKYSMKFFGIPTISYGYPEAPDNTYEVVALEGEDYYYKVIYKDGILYGAIIQGDIAGAGVMGKLIEGKYNLSKKLDKGDLSKIFSLSYGDFFSEKADGSFEFVV